MATPKATPERKSNANTPASASKIIPFNNESDVASFTSSPSAARLAAKTLASSAIAKAVAREHAAAAKQPPAGQPTQRTASKTSALRRSFKQQSEDAAGAPVPRRESTFGQNQKKINHLYNVNPMEKVAFGRSNVTATNPSIGYNAALPPPTMHDPSTATHGGVRSLLLKDLRRELRARGASPAGGVDVLRDRLTKELARAGAEPLADPAVNVKAEVPAGTGGDSDSLSRSRQWMLTRPQTAPRVTDSQVALDHEDTPWNAPVAPMSPAYGRKAGLQSPGGNPRPGVRKLNVFTMHPSVQFDEPFSPQRENDSGEIVPAGDAGTEVYSSGDMPGREGRLRHRGATTTSHDILMGEMQRASGMRGGGCIFDVTEDDRTRRRDDYVELLNKKEVKAKNTSGRGGYMHQSQVFNNEQPAAAVGEEHLAEHRRASRRYNQGVGFSLLRGGYGTKPDAEDNVGVRSMNRSVPRPQSARPAVRDPGPLGESSVMSQVTFG